MAGLINSLRLQYEALKGSAWKLSNPYCESEHPCWPYPHWNRKFKRGSFHSVPTKQVRSKATAGTNRKPHCKGCKYGKYKQKQQMGKRIRKWKQPTADKVTDKKAIHDTIRHALTTECFTYLTVNPKLQVHPVCTSQKTNGYSQMPPYCLQKTAFKETLSSKTCFKIFDIFNCNRWGIPYLSPKM